MLFWKFWTLLLLAAVMFRMVFPFLIAPVVFVLDPKQAKTFSFFADRYGGSAGAQSERYRRRAVVVCRVVGVP
jgi:hypothetical protein